MSPLPRGLARWGLYHLFLDVNGELLVPVGFREGGVIHEVFVELLLQAICVLPSPSEQNQHDLGLSKALLHNYLWCLYT